jgi:hypothetical protein
MGHKLTMCFREAWGKCLYFSLATVVNNMKYYYYYYFGTNEPIHCEEEERTEYYFVKPKYLDFIICILYSRVNLVIK